MKRSRSSPARDSRHASGLLPYMPARSRGWSGARSARESSAPWKSASSMVQTGAMPAWTITNPRSGSRRITGRSRSQSTSASPSAASSTSRKVSLARSGRIPRALATKCRSWLPRTASARSPRSATNRSTSSELGPRLTRSPTNQSVSRRASNPPRAQQRAQLAVAALDIADRVGGHAGFSPERGGCPFAARFAPTRRIRDRSTKSRANLLHWNQGLSPSRTSRMRHSRNVRRLGPVKAGVRGPRRAPMRPAVAARTNARDRLLRPHCRHQCTTFGTDRLKAGIGASKRWPSSATIW